MEQQQQQRGLKKKQHQLRCSQRFNFYFLVVFIIANEQRCFSEGLQLGKCQTTLGMQTGDILDSALTSSSSIDPLNLGPESARIRSEIRGGAWCPKEEISKDVYEYLEVDLLKLHVVSLVETQGRFGNGQGEDYTEQYRLEYQRETDDKWIHFRNRRGHEIIQGNTNTHTAELREIQPPIIARRIRFVPYSVRPQIVCLRVELYGCRWSDGVTSYEMPDGEQRGLELYFNDATYDGTIDDGYLSGGLGQLCDGNEGQSNFRLDPLSLGVRGYEWIGWRNDSFANGFLSITFIFDQLRNFTDVMIHCSNVFSKDVRVFSRARIFFGGTEESSVKTFDADPVEFYYARDDVMEYARNVVIPLKSHVGRFVKAEFFFSSKWLMISEIQFISELFEPDVKEDYLSSSLSSFSSSSSSSLIESWNGGDRQTTPGDLIERNNRTASKSLFNFSVKSRNSIDRNPPEESESNETVSNKFLDETTKLSNASRLENKKRKNLDDEWVVIIITVLVVVLLTLCALTVIIVFKRSRYSCCIIGRRSEMTKSLPSSTANRSYSSSSLPGTRLVSLFQSSSFLHETSVPQAYLIPKCYHDVDATGLHVAPTYPSYVSPYATVDIISIPHVMQKRKGEEDDDWGLRDRYHSMPNTGQQKTQAMPLNEIPKENLKFLKSLGEGNSGEFYLCEMIQQRTSTQTGTMSSCSAVDRSTLVAVKVASENASDQAREDFQCEASAMSRLNDRNIVNVLGVNMKSDPYFMIMEFPSNGDLKQFLQNRVLSVETAQHLDNKESISYGCLAYIASQIASGMKFLERSNIVHRDLATRNCLIGRDFTVKISNFGTSHLIYPSDYYCCKSKTTSSSSSPFSTSSCDLFMPIRWMAWEAICLSEFSTKSDVWAFGVTMWEILTLARHPYEALTDKQVIMNSNNLNQGHRGGLWIALQRPDICPREIYDLLCHCWNRDKYQRPAFHEVHMFLERKNSGYKPERNRSVQPNHVTSLFI